MDFDLFNRPHPHPLIFNQEGKLNGEIVCCSRCNGELLPPAFSCLDCRFHLHQECIELPKEIQTQFHPQHTLALEKTNYPCNCCWQMPRGFSYKCSECNFLIDIKCALADTKSSSLTGKGDTEFLHFGHEHPLIFQPDGKHKQVVCHICDNLITSAPIYFCSPCVFYIHKSCAELPREKRLPVHPDHPLLLFAQPPEPVTRNTTCDSCKNECREFIYRCPECNFNLHISCLSPFKHQHIFIKFRKVLPFHCQACGTEGYGFPWFCSICHLWAHKKCAESPPHLKTRDHDHSLYLTYSLDLVDVTKTNKLFCEICREGINNSYAGYVCYQCNYVAHLDCAWDQRSKTLFEDEKQDMKLAWTEAADSRIKHFSHNHDLNLFSGELRHDKRCDGCMEGISAQSYGCAQCDFFLHSECARLPIQKTYFFHPPSLDLIYIPDFVFRCNACLQYFHGFAYYCKESLFTLDIRCASISNEVIHSSHHHPLHLAQIRGQQNCRACRQTITNNMAFRCVDCDYSLDYKCATLPLAVRNRLDAHPLNLSYVAEDETGEYYCHICEEKRDPNHWFYYCKMCSFAAHPACVLGEYPYLKFGLNEAHLHPLTLVEKSKKDDSRCHACHKSCSDSLAYECARCKFNVHAVGSCYHNQILQSKITLKK